MLDEYEHDDIVWARHTAATNAARMPARVFDKAMIALEPDRAVAERVSRVRAPSDGDAASSLVVFFDAEKSARYVSHANLELCDVRLKPAGVSATIVAAWQRAKEYFNR